MSLELAVRALKGRAAPLPEPELRLHSDWVQALKRAKIAHVAWGSAGPDILVTHSRAILEVKKTEAKALVKEAYAEIFARAGTRFDPSTVPFVGVITPAKVRIWRNTSEGYGPVDAPDIEFAANERSAVLALLADKTIGVQLLLDDHIDAALRVVYSAECPDHVAALLSVLNLHKRPVQYTNSAIYFAPGSPDERQILVTPAARAFISTEIINKFSVGDPAAVKQHIRHQWSQYQPDGKKAGLGKYYTPEHLVETVKGLLAPVLDAHPTSYVADLAAGCGAFLAGFEEFRILGRDIDEQAVSVLKEMGFPHIACENSLANVNRRKLGLSDTDDLILVGNPPYNDTTSLNKRYSTDKKDALAVTIDADVKSKDLGISFLRAFAKLRPNAICVLHPLSYLTKAQNFAALREFSSSYRLESAVVFSSAEFGANIGAKTPFSIVAALYLPGKMDYDHIRKFVFPIHVSTDGQFADSGKRLVIGRVETIDGKGGIRKYPPTRGMPTGSDIGLYNYNIRDTNSLLTSGALTAKQDEHRIPVQFEELWKYSYLSCMKRYFGRNFVFSNLSPVCRREDFEQVWFRNACVLDTIMNHSHLPPMARTNPASFVVDRFVLNDAMRLARSFARPGMPNFYKAFVEYWKKGTPNAGVLKVWFERYFAELRDEFIRESDEDN